MRFIHKFTVTTKQQLLLLTHVFFTNACLILGSLYILKISLLSLGFMIVFALFFFIDTLPTIILHIQYWIKNGDAILVVDTESKQLTYEQFNKRLSYCFGDIDHLEYYRSYGKGSGWNSFGQYRFYKVIFRDNAQIIVTCLMINNIENTFEMLIRMNSTKHFKVLCLVRKDSNLERL